ncbi:MAG: VWA domain-containing protein [Acidobacteria bacterium]|nr:VWA domain-containing protein [Acidobacteriota bacterium]MBI3424911.1 VWA domain-containing protein [Acidobacteriota bacterium]
MQSSNSSLKQRRIRFALLLSTSLSLLLPVLPAFSQSGRNVINNRRTLVIPVIAQRVDDPNKPKRLLASTEDKAEVEKFISKLELELFDGSVLQKVESFAPDPTPARIVVLLDNSATIQTDVKKLASVPAAFAPEIYEGDKVQVIGYDTKPEVITEWTDKPEDLQNTVALLRKTDAPHLFDALDVTMEDVLRPEVGFSKRIIVIVGDGLDRDSKIKFEKLLATLQDENITVYAIQVRDRTRGALRKNAPKAAEALEKLTEGTGGKIFPIDGDIKVAVKEICDELRNDRYQLTYYPEGINPINKRLLLISSSDQTIKMRHKAYHPPRGQ